MKIHYTVETTTIRCPHCGKIISQETRGEFEPFFRLLTALLLPILVPYWIIKYFGFLSPEKPNIGPKYITCSVCKKSIRTFNRAVEDLTGKDLLIHRFVPWFYVCYFLGIVLFISSLCLISDEYTMLSVCGLITLLSLIGVIVIIVTYRIKLSKCNQTKNCESPPKTKNIEHQSIMGNTVGERLFCRKCGKKLPLDSKFCSGCGTEVIEMSKSGM